MTAEIKKIEEILGASFSMDNYVSLIGEIFSSAKTISPYKQQKEYSNFSSHIVGYSHVANYTTPDEKKLIILAVELQKDAYVETSRSTQRSYAKKLIESSNSDAAVVAFYTTGETKWRLSFVRLDYEMKFENGKLKAVENITPARRYSFLVGEDEPSHTAIERLHSFIADKNSQPTLDELEEVFSVEKVTKEFFDLYCEKYHELREHLLTNEDFLAESEKCGFTAEQFAKKLMGQIVFLYFLQKKGWLGVGVWPTELTEKEYNNVFYTRGAQRRLIQEYLPQVYLKKGDRFVLRSSALDVIPDDAEEMIANNLPKDESKNWGAGSKKFLRTLFNYSKRRSGNFFNDYLEPLFYNTLNKNRGAMGYSPLLHCRIPFLSGGLFEPINGYQWEVSNFNIPDHIFSNKTGDDDRTADGILDIFDRYNFTMSEDEPMEREVAIDPEMLGKVFENLLDVTDRKSKGAFYTPREIVHYMCQESLINYLVNATGIAEDGIRDLILYGDFMKDEDTVKTIRTVDDNGRIHMKFDYSKDMYISEEILSFKNNVNHLNDIDHALADIRVADPAVGSGAFPLGMLNEIVRARQCLTEYMALVVAKTAVSDAQASFFIWELRRERTAYDLKLYAIKNSIFAVDIEPSAVDIAQLRLWLSLVIDDEINPSATNVLEGHRNPLPLPNLESNILCGNSLIDEFEGIPLLNQSDILGISRDGGQNDMATSAFEAVLPKLLEAQDALFYCEDPAKKIQLIEEVESLKNMVIEPQLYVMSPEVRERYEGAKNMASKPYVLWQLEFARVYRDKGGFDVVIGNPPYGLLNKKQNQNTSIMATPQEVNYYKTKDIYKAAKGGMINIFRLFICKSHDLLRKNGHMSLIFPMAFMCDLSAYELRKYIFHNASVDYIEAFPERDSENKRVFRSAKMSVCILGSNKRIEAYTHPFKMRINDDRFVNTSYEQVQISPAEIEEIDSKALTIPLVNSKELEILVKMCHGSKRMKEYSKCYTGEIDLSLDKNYVRLDDSYHRMLRGAQVQQFYLTDNISQGDIFYLDSEMYLANVHTPRSQHYLNRRIVMQGITGVNERYRLKMTITREGVFCANSVNYLLPKDNIEYLLGLCNSHLLNWFFKKLSTNSNVNGYEVDNLPIKWPSLEQGQQLSEIVSKLLNKISEDNPHDINLENELNSCVYEIYGITQDEIAEIERIYA